MVNFSWENKRHGGVLKELFRVDPNVTGQQIVQKTTAIAADPKYDSLRECQFSIKVLNDKLRSLSNAIETSPQASTTSKPTQLSVALGTFGMSSAAGNSSSSSSSSRLPTRSADEDDPDATVNAVTPMASSGPKRKYDELAEDEDVPVPVEVFNLPIVGASYTSAVSTSSEHNTVTTLLSPPEGAKFFDATVAKIPGNEAVIRFKWVDSIVDQEDYIGDEIATDPKRIALVHEMERIRKRNKVEGLNVVGPTGQKPHVDVLTTYKLTLPFKVDPEPLAMRFWTKNATRVFEITFRRFKEAQGTRTVRLTA